MGGGGSGGGAQKKGEKRGSADLLAPDLGVEDEAEAVLLGAGAGAGGREQLVAVPLAAPVEDDESW